MGKFYAEVRGMWIVHIYRPTEEEAAQYSLYHNANVKILTDSEDVLVELVAWLSSEYTGRYREEILEAAMAKV